VSAFIDRTLDPVLAIGWSWTFYVVALHVALLAGVTALLASSCRRTAAATRAALWDIAPVALLGVTILCDQPFGWGAWIIPRFAADPLVTLGGLDVAARTASSPVRETFDLGRLLAARLAWYAGVVIMGSRVLWTWRSVTAVARRGVPVREPAFLELLARSRARMAVRRPVALRSTHEVASPFVIGIRRPVIVVPHAALTWSEELRRSVLLHELAHVKRHDCAVQLLAQAMRALYWFHPAAWLVASRQRAARELACDAMVIAAGERRSSYAECLLHLSSLIGCEDVALAGSVAAGLVRPSSINRRLRELLERARLTPRRPRLSQTFTALCMSAVVVTLGSVRLAPTPGVLWRALDSQDWAVRRYAAYVLVHRRDPALVARVRARIAADPDPRVARRL
jgi:beta-lactamase regulating signal transducer with metallopeptidase domain